MATEEEMKLAADDANKFLQDLKERTKRAIVANDAIMAQLYNDLVKKTSPVVTKLYMRIDRAEKAILNKGAKKLIREDWEKTVAARGNDKESEQEFS